MYFFQKRECGNSENKWRAETRAGKKNRIRKTEPIPIRKSSTEPETKLIKYPNGFKILVSKEPNPNPTRTEVFRVSECIRNRFIYIKILIIFRFNVY